MCSYTSQNNYLHLVAICTIAIDHRKKQSNCLPYFFIPDFAVAKFACGWRKMHGILVEVNPENTEGTVSIVKVKPWQWKSPTWFSYLGLNRWFSFVNYAIEFLLHNLGLTLSSVMAKTNRLNQRPFSPSRIAVPQKRSGKYQLQHS